MTTVLKILSRILGKDLTHDSKISTSDTMWHLAAKGIVPLARGSLHRFRMKSVRGLFFLGQGCKLLAPNKLSCGRNVYIGQHSYIDCLSTNGVHLGNNVTLREGAWMQLTSIYANPGDTIEIQDHVYIGPYSILGAAAPIIIGTHTQIGARVSLIAENHVYTDSQPIHTQGVTRKGIRIGRNCWVGNNVTILDGVTVGDNSVVGAGAVVTKSFPPNCVLAGVPAKIIKMRPS